MTSEFFLVVCACLALPALIGKLLGSERLLPLVFVQIIFGVAVQLSGLNGWLQGQGVDILHSQLGASVQGIGWLGIALLVALTGAEAMPSETERQSLHFVPISLLGFGLTLAAGALLALNLLTTNPELLGQNGTPTTFAFAVGICLAVTALPVLVAILKETGLSDTPVGKLAVLCALLDDLWLWLGLAAILSLAGLQDAHPGRTLLAVGAYFCLMFMIVRPSLRAMYPDAEERSMGPLFGVCVVLLSAAATDALGVHAILGAFVGGAVLPQSALRKWRPSASHVVKSMLTPVFFVITGLHLQIEWRDPNFWGLVTVFAVTATGIKAGTVALVARLGGMDWSQGMLLGTLMQCKGLMELVAINVLYDAKIIGTVTYSALAVMAVISTLVTAPLLRFWTLRTAKMPLSHGQ